MKPRRRWSDPPPLPLGLAVAAMLTGLWCWYHVVLFRQYVMPLSYALPLLASVWIGRRRLLWAMAAIFAAAALYQFFTVLPGTFVGPELRWPILLARLANILVAAGIVHAIIHLRQRLEARNAALEAASARIARQNESLQATNNELAARDEEITHHHTELQTQAEELARQNQELHQQTEELHQQAEELQSQSEDLQSVNEDLARREQMLSTMLESARGLAAETEVLTQICRSGLELIGPPAAAAAVVERITSDGEQTAVHSHVGFGQEGPQISRWPWSRSLAALVTKHGRTAQLADIALRPDIAIPQPRTGAPLRSILAAPLRIKGEFAGAVEFYASTPHEWTAEQFRLAEWVAGHCSLILESLRRRDELRSVALFPEQNPNPVLRIAGNAALLYANRASDVLLIHWKCHVGQAAPQPLLEHVRAALESGANSEGEFAIANRVFSLLFSPSCDQGYVNVYGRDITIRHEAQEAMRQAMERAEAANKAKDQFLAVLSHELRTPLTPVVMAAAAMETDAKLPLWAREQLGMIHRNVQLEARLIDDLLDLTRIARGKLQMRREITDVHAAIEHAVAVCSTAQARARGLSVRTLLEARDCRIWGDASRLQQVFWNLLSNALKFSRDGGEVQVRSHSDDGRLSITVTDTGVGIRPDVLPRLFTAFEQGSTGTTRQFGGLGLGLAISKAIVDMHAGRIHADSAGHNKGAVFTVELPLAPEGDPAVEGSAETDIQRHETAGRSPGILLVEDHPDTARILSRLLRGDGYRVVVAHDVESALALARRELEAIDLIISDVGLPDGTGLELMQQLRADSDVRGIALSGYGMEEDVQNSLAAGFAEHLTKPVNFDALKAAIARAIR